LKKKKKKKRGVKTLPSWRVFKTTLGWNTEHDTKRKKQKRRVEVKLL